MTVRASILGLWLAAAAFAQSVITTIAGTDWIFPGDNKPAVEAPLGGFLAMGVAADQDGNFYIADDVTHHVGTIDGVGITSPMAGNGQAGLAGDGCGATAASLDFINGVAVDNIGNLYLAISGNTAPQGVVRKVDANGIITTI